jgi:sugar phosphate isomerase/epimerase
MSGKTDERLIALASGVHDGNPPDVSPQDMARIAGEVGYNSVGLWVAPDENWHKETTGAVRQILTDYHLVPLDVEVIWLQPGADPDPLHHRIIDIGGELGARNCLIVSSEPNRDNTKRLYEDLCRRAADAGMRACLEYMGITEIKTLDAALDVVASVDHPAGGILVDAFHHERVGHAPGAVSKIPPQWLSYVQLCDMPKRGTLSDPAAYLEDALDGRLAPGEGALPLADLMAALPDGVHAELPISLEIRSRHYRETHPNPLTRARTILEKTNSFLNGL